MYLEAEFLAKVPDYIVTRDATWDRRPTAPAVTPQARSPYWSTRILYMEPLAVHCT